MWNLKSNTNESTYKTEPDLQSQKTNFWLPKGEEGERIDQEVRVTDTNY